MIVKGGYLIETFPAVEGDTLLTSNPERRVIRHPSPATINNPVNSMS